MKRLLSIAVGICCLCALAENPKGNPQIVSRVSDTKVRPVIDGTVNAEEWVDAAILMPFCIYRFSEPLLMYIPWLRSIFLIRLAER